jgi:hypothetical protein
MADSKNNDLDKRIEEQKKKKAEYLSKKPVKVYNEMENKVSTILRADIKLWQADGYEVVDEEAEKVEKEALKKKKK